MFKLPIKCRYSTLYKVDIGLYIYTVKPVLSGHSKRRAKFGLQDRLLLNAGQKYVYSRMLQGEHSAILSTFIKLKLLFVIKIFVLSILSQGSIKFPFKRTVCPVFLMNYCPIIPRKPYKVQ